MYKLVNFLTLGSNKIELKIKQFQFQYPPFYHVRYPKGKDVVNILQLREAQGCKEGGGRRVMANQYDIGRRGGATVATIAPPNCST